ncbi:MAG: sensor histidine kinase N-terminal domain-containing protein [Arenimonas sp.]|nr:sensor histidine kinase N-terminal domain-containing protein [Arenimonas sp.]
MSRPASLRRTLLLGILGPVLVLVALNGIGLYGRALAALNTAYDRTLLASAKSIGEQLDVVGEGRDAVLRSTVPYSALEAFEADTRNRLFYRVSSLQGELVSGYPDLPFWRGELPAQPPFQALVDFYDDALGGEEVRVAVLLQPVAGAGGRGMAVIQVAETLELRRAAARRILLDTLWRQALLVAVIAAVVVVVVQRATRPVRGLSARLAARPEGDLTPLPADGAPRELLPLLDATNGVMARLARLLAHRQRFVRDAAHQLRTPLAVLKAQVQSGLRGDVDARQALQEAALTVDRATELANQMLALAKVEQLRGGREEAVHDFGALLRELALEVSPLVAQRDLDFDIAVQPAPVRAHEWMLRELGRNLLHNAIRHSPPGAPLSVRLVTANGWAALTVADRGPGIAAELRERLFQPFAAGDPRSGSGLGLAICLEIVQALGGAIALDNRLSGSRISGLDATVRLPLATIATDGQASD